MNEALDDSIKLLIKRNTEKLVFEGVSRQRIYRFSPFPRLQKLTN
jgi:hypothetical protein